MKYLKTYEELKTPSMQNKVYYVFEVLNHYQITGYSNYVNKDFFIGNFHWYGIVTSPKFQFCIYSLKYLETPIYKKGDVEYCIEQNELEDFEKNINILKKFRSKKQAIEYLRMLETSKHYNL